MAHAPEDSGSSLSQLFNQLDIILVEQYQISNTPWMHIARLKGILHQRYGIFLDIDIQNYGLGNDLKSLLKSGQRFAIYSTAMAQEFYLARLQDAVPKHHQNHGKTIHYLIKRPWKVDQCLINMLENEGAKRLSSHPSPNTLIHRSAHRPTLPSRLFSIDDLEFALTEILKHLTHNHPEKATTIAALSKTFYNYYRQPIRTVVRSLCPGMTLIDVLEIIPDFEMLEDDDGNVIVYVIEI